MERGIEAGWGPQGCSELIGEVLGPNWESKLSPLDSKWPQSLNGDILRLYKSEGGRLSNFPTKQRKALEVMIQKSKGMTLEEWKINNAQLKVETEQRDKELESAMKFWAFVAGKSSSVNTLEFTNKAVAKKAKVAPREWSSSVTASLKPFVLKALAEMVSQQLADRAALKEDNANWDTLLEAPIKHILTEADFAALQDELRGGDDAENETEQTEAATTDGNSTSGTSGTLADMKVDILRESNVSSVETAVSLAVAHLAKAHRQGKRFTAELETGLLILPSLIQTGDSFKIVFGLLSCAFAPEAIPKIVFKNREYTITQKTPKTTLTAFVTSLSNLVRSASDIGGVITIELAPQPEEPLEAQEAASEEAAAKSQPEEAAAESLPEEAAPQPRTEAERLPQPGANQESSPSESTVALTTTEPEGSSSVLSSEGIAPVNEIEPTDVLSDGGASCASGVVTAETTETGAPAPTTVAADIGAAPASEPSATPSELSVASNEVAPSTSAASESTVESAEAVKGGAVGSKTRKRRFEETEGSTSENPPLQKIAKTSS